MKKILLNIFILFAFSATVVAGNSPTTGGPGDKTPVVKSFPNPVATELTVEVILSSQNFTKVEVKVVNLLGQEMLPVVKEDLNGLYTTLKIDVREVPAGFYFMEVTTSSSDGSSHTYTKKITKN